MELQEIARRLGQSHQITIENILAHPQLQNARRAYLDSFLKIYEGDSFTTRLLIESGRFFVYYIILMMESAYDPLRQETWPTVGRLKEMMTTFGLSRASGRHIDELIGRLCAVGFIESRPSELDKRVRILTTGEKLRQHDRDWLVANYVPLAMLYPQFGYAPLLERDPHFQIRYRRASVPYIGLGATLLTEIPDIMVFFDYVAGPLVVSALLQAGMIGDGEPTVDVSYADIGDRFGVSRTHVRQVIAAAEERGLVKIHARGGKRLEILPRMWKSHDAGMARGMYFHHVLYMATMSDLGDASALSPAG